MKLQLQRNSEYASIPSRWLALLIDGQIFALPVWWAWGYLILPSPSLAQLIPNFLTALAFVFLPLLLLRFFYDLIGLSHFGKTIGKAVLGLEVTYADHRYLSWKRVLLREHIAKMVSGAVIGLGFWSVLFEPQHRAWHDLLAQSVVRRGQNRLLLGILVIGLLVGVEIFFLVHILQVVLANHSLLSEVSGLFNQLLSSIRNTASDL